MESCPACEAIGYVVGSACSTCGYKGLAEGDMPDLVLEPTKRGPAKPPPAKPTASKRSEVSLELAVDMRSQYAPVEERPPPVSAGSGYEMAASPRPNVVAPVASSSAVRPQDRPQDPRAVDDDAEQARILAAYGEAPTSVLRAPMYAYRVFKRHGELKRALAERKVEASEAEETLLSSLVAIGERVGPVAAGKPPYARVLSELAAAEALLKSRDANLAREQEAYLARMRVMDQAASVAERELSEARQRERAHSDAVANARAELERANQKLVRAEQELKAVADAAAPHRGERVGKV